VKETYKGIAKDRLMIGEGRRVIKELKSILSPVGHGRFVPSQGIAGQKTDAHKVKNKRQTGNPLSTEINK